MQMLASACRDYSEFRDRRLYRRGGPLALRRDSLAQAFAAERRRDESADDRCGESYVPRADRPVRRPTRRRTDQSPGPAGLFTWLERADIMKLDPTGRRRAGNGGEAVPRTTRAQAIGGGGSAPLTCFRFLARDRTRSFERLGGWGVGGQGKRPQGERQPDSNVFGQISRQSSPCRAINASRAWRFLTMLFWA
jgi:hypothetical protein